MFYMLLGTGGEDGSIVVVVQAYSHRRFELSGAVIVTSSYVLHSYGTKLNIGLQPDPRASGLATPD